ncbi:unnamed protein product [Parascedosporium putredinis]|uniref:F-box domain-containing protein n=1 Tax=Parascedosporium putredinis TaxID=1442378 RepID=A0A9P1H1T4_9PEZI|nr:unnamed protein product [Parascedosporium putredinis]CAI7994089.1 unnamed protein product [Parascedosporium putredinis]
MSQEANQPPSASALMDLPTEILLGIIAQLGARDVTALSATCTTMTNLCDPVRYRCVSLRSRRNCTSPQALVRRHVCLLRAILRRPHVLQYIKTLLVKTKWRGHDGGSARARALMVFEQSSGPTDKGIKECLREMRLQEPEALSLHRLPAASRALVDVCLSERRQRRQRGEDERNWAEDLEQAWSSSEDIKALIACLTPNLKTINWLGTCSSGRFLKTFRDNVDAVYADPRFRHMLQHLVRYPYFNFGQVCEKCGRNHAAES